jgi:hypothetical protein
MSEQAVGNEQEIAYDRDGTESQDVVMQKARQDCERGCESQDIDPRHVPPSKSVSFNAQSLTRVALSDGGKRRIGIPIAGVC